MLNKYFNEIARQEYMNEVAVITSAVTEFNKSADKECKKIIDDLILDKRDCSSLKEFLQKEIKPGDYHNFKLTFFDSYKTENYFLLDDDVHIPIRSQTIYKMLTYELVSPGKTEVTKRLNTRFATNQSIGSNILDTHFLTFTVKITYEKSERVKSHVDCLIDINKLEDDWFLVRKDFRSPASPAARRLARDSLFYKCDGFLGLLKCLQSIMAD